MDTADLIRRHGIPVAVVSSGGTGTHFITGYYPGVTEIQVGSYITMDSQYREGVGIDFAYGLTVLATVVRAPTPDRAECDAGLKTMTRDFGLPVVISPPGWELVGLAEEHGHLRRAGGAPLKPGDKVEIVPNHGCTTINLHDEYHVIRRGVLEAVWPIAGRGRSVEQRHAAIRGQTGVDHRRGPGDRSGDGRTFRRGRARICCWPTARLSCSIRRPRKSGHSMACRCGSTSWTFPRRPRSRGWWPSPWRNLAALTCSSTTRGSA